MIALRLAAPEDAANLLAIYRPYVEKTSVSFETEAPSETEFRRRIEDFSKTFPYLVAEEDGEILGYAYAHAFHERAAFDWTVETTIYVSEHAHRTGVGRKLYKALLELLKRQGVCTAVAVVTVPNDPSIGFHRALGFVPCGTLDHVGFKLGFWRGVSYLCLPLRSGDSAPAPLIPIGSLEPETVQHVLRGTNL